MSIWHAEPAPPSSPVVYQLRVVLRGVRPLIWRRLLVPDTTTIADLHAVMQSAFGWAGEHLHRFVIHGREYGISYPGGVGFRDNPRRLWLAGFGLRAGERFVYEYDFIDGWRHDIRVEQLVRPEPGRVYRSALAGGGLPVGGLRGRVGVPGTVAAAIACSWSPVGWPTCSTTCSAVAAASPNGATSCVTCSRG